MTIPTLEVSYWNMFLLPPPNKNTAGLGEPESLMSPTYAARLEKLKGILSGRTPTGLYLDFLYRHNHADLQILKNIKVSLVDSVCVCGWRYLYRHNYIDPEKQQGAHAQGAEEYQKDGWPFIF
jgi:hypothetical protein